MATKTWTGGTGTWDSTSGTNWSGGTAPVNGDTIVFDGTSGTGTVTVAANVSGQSFVSITMGAFVGTLDFSVNNPNLTITGSLSTAGSAVRSLKMGNGTWTFTRSTAGSWVDFTTSTNMSLDTGSGTILIQPSASITGFCGVGLNSAFTLNNVTVNLPAIAGASSFRGIFGFFNSGTITTLVFSNVYNVQFSGGNTTTITNGFSINGGNSSQKILIISQSLNAVATLSLGGAVTCSWGAIQNITVTGAGSFTATNSFDLGGNTSITITPPAASGGGSMIGA